MKVNVITRHAISNYGSFLQSLATINIFKELGYDCKIIDYISKEEDNAKRAKAYAKIQYKGFLKRTAYVTLKVFADSFSTKKFSKFRKKELNLTKKFTTLQALQKEDFSDSYLCAGSDQLWGEVHVDGSIDPAYFLEFGSDKNKYFSFSSSFGRVDFDQDFFKQLNVYLQKFSFITVREQSGVKLVNDNTDFTAQHVLDPTLMIGREFWQSYADCKIKEKPYVLLYQLYYVKEIDDFCTELAKREGLNVIRISCNFMDKFRKGKNKVLKPPKYVLSLFKNAKYVISNSFHATVFSLLFNKEFIDFMPRGGTSSRITDLLSTVGLSERVSTGKEADFDIIKNPVDWQSVNSILSEKCLESREIVQKNLGLLEKE
ncbi:MAG: polysaccharide pyruvyl transferase family protein [Clostridiales bacterium]|nr:polysaccharide pyruvyl transferase family protein [Clostridiales bacterium]